MKFIPTTTSPRPEFYPLAHSCCSTVLHRLFDCGTSPWHCWIQLFWAFLLTLTARVKWFQCFPTVRSLNFEHLHLSLSTLTSSYLSYMWHSVFKHEPWSTQCSLRATGTSPITSLASGSCPPPPRCPAPLFLPVSQDPSNSCIWGSCLTAQVHQVTFILNS